MEIFKKPRIFLINNQPITSSIDIAVCFDLPHSNIIDKIELIKNTHGEKHFKNNFRIFTWCTKNNIWLYRYHVKLGGMLLIELENKSLKNEYIKKFNKYQNNFHIEKIA